MTGHKGHSNSILAFSNDSNSNRSNTSNPSLDTTEKQELAVPNNFSCKFTWEEFDSECFIPARASAYKEIVHWQQNILLVPSSTSGKELVLEMTRLFTAILTGANNNANCDVHASPTIAEVTQALESDGPHLVPESTLI